jgi:hypothetical protein
VCKGGSRDVNGDDKEEEEEEEEEGKEKGALE